jgi:putative methionine-R-sulfoxide reductase with GAF domain
MTQIIATSEAGGFVARKHLGLIRLYRANTSHAIAIIRQGKLIGVDDIQGNRLERLDESELSDLKKLAFKFQNQRKK